MPLRAVTGAVMTCSFGAAPSSLNASGAASVITGGTPAATILDHIPFANIPPFGMCASLSNPAVASATSAAAGTLTPQPCTPVTPAPWAPGAATVISGVAPALHDSCVLNCAFAGVIKISFAGQTTTFVS